MRDRTSLAWASALGASLAVLALTLVTGAGGQGPSGADASRWMVPKSRIIAFDDTIGLLDTSNGAIHRLHGDARNPNVRSQWVAHVAPVSGVTSGVLQLQKPEGVNTQSDATFLVDVVTGDTWLLRRLVDEGRNSGRAVDRATWVPVSVQR